MTYPAHSRKTTRPGASIQAMVFALFFLPVSPLFALDESKVLDEPGREATTVDSATARPDGALSDQPATATNNVPAPAAKNSTPEKQNRQPYSKTIVDTTPSLKSGEAKPGQSTESSPFDDVAKDVKPAVPEPPPPPPIKNSVLWHTILASAKKTRLDGAKEALTQLYKNANEAVLWSANGKPTAQAEEMMTAFKAAAEEGLNTQSYQLKPLSGAEPSAAIQFDVALSLATMRYLSAVHEGLFNPYPVTEQDKLNLAALTTQLAKEANPSVISAMIESVEPPFQVYRGMKQNLTKYRALQQAQKVANPIIKGTLKPGESNRAVPDLRRMLRIVGDLPEMVAIDKISEESTRYDDQLVEAIKQFQKRHGLKVDGVIGPATKAELSMPLDKRIQQIVVGLERIRWLPKKMDKTYLIANIPAFELYGFRGGSTIDKPDMVLNVVVGKMTKNGKYKTPIFQADMKYVIFSPYWNVPYSITKKELLPIIRRSPGYLSSKNMEIVGSPSGLASGKSRIRQRPGKGNALGGVKFIFPNNHSVYMHDTPSKRLFSRSSRAFSHGCVRVQHPERLAEFVLEEQGGWNKAKIKKNMGRSKQRHVTLKETVPVYIFYMTTLINEQGRMRFYRDVYHRDEALWEKLNKVHS